MTMVEVSKLNTQFVVVKYDTPTLFMPKIIDLFTQKDW